MSSPHVIAVLDTSKETTSVLSAAIERAGYRVAKAFTHEIRDGEVDIEPFMAEHRPTAVVYDVGIPYEANWQLFEAVRSHPATHGVPFVITCVNVDQVRKFAGPDEEIIEIAGDSYDLRRVVRAIDHGIDRSMSRKAQEKSRNGQGDVAP